MQLKHIISIVIFFFISMHQSIVNAADQSGWFITPFIGLSQLSGFDATANSIDGLSGNAEVDTDSGLNAGLSVGYRYNDRFAMEFGWEYRSNDSAVNIADESVFDEGNYASNSFFLNGYYYLSQRGAWQPYVGAGLIWMQEIDIDLERNGIEQSYSGDGDVGLQVFAGVNYQLSRNWQLQTQLRYGSLSDIELSGEEGAVGEFSDFDYQPITLQIGTTYRF